MTTGKNTDSTGGSEPEIDFEKSLAELENIVERLERGDLPLEESLRQFERGIELTRACQGALSRAEQKVEILMRRSGRSDVPDEAMPYEPPPDT